MIYNTIILAKDLSENLNDPNWLLLDCRSISKNDKYSYQNYTQGHIPNAYYLSLMSNSIEGKSILESDPIFLLNHVIATLEEIGFNPEAQIVLYDEQESETVNQLWLQLRSLGLKHIAVLRGGFQSWKDQNYPLSQNCASEAIDL